MKYSDIQIYNAYYLTYNKYTIIVSVRRFVSIYSIILVVSATLFASK